MADDDEKKYVVNSFKNANALCARQETSRRILRSHAGHVPVVVERVHGRTPVMDKNKFVVPSTYTVGHLVYMMRKRMPEVRRHQAIFLFVAVGVLPPTSTSVAQLYDEHRDEDGMLYVRYSLEHTFG